jgi:diketogulonate reductase-like aldo/keto reductase
VDLAVRNGFRGIDTACQPKHYFEPGVGDALVKLFADGIVKRNDIFIQTKYTPYTGQDPNNVPCDKNANYRDQVLQSYQKSLENLKVTYLDSLVLHSPMSNHEDTMEVWKTFESIHSDGGVIYIGISNCYDLETLESLYKDAKVKPSFLQNRFYSESGYDRTIRTFCMENNIKYQSFWSLTANPKALQR